MMHRTFVLITLLSITFQGALQAQESSDAQKIEYGKQVERSFKTTDGAEVPYLLYVPSEAKESKDKLPLVLFLHGRGESYGPLSLVAKWGPPKYAARGDALPYILVSPQCPGKDFWNSDLQNKRVMELLDAMIKTHGPDESRIYVTGLSMGGYGTWSLLAKHADRFAAAMPVCGGGDPKQAAEMLDTPIWVFHGDRDRPVPFSKSVEMVEAIKDAGGKNIRFTTYENIGHNCWSATYATPEVWSWLLSQRSKD